MATVTYIKERRQSVGAMRAVIAYCQREDKTVDPITGRRFVSGIHCDGLNAATEFMATKGAYHKMDGIYFYQYVQSFSPKENVTYQQAHQIALEFAEKAWPGQEVLVTTHCDTAHPHSHFIINSVSYEIGKKLRQDPNTLRQLRAVSDAICVAHGLNILPTYRKGGQKLSAREYRAAQKGQSWKVRLMFTVNKAMEKSAGREDFIKLMNRVGYQVHWTDERKYILHPEICTKEEGDKMKLLIGGSPCTHWSIAQTKNRETEPKGLGWELFKNYKIALDTPGSGEATDQ